MDHENPATVIRAFGPEDRPAGLLLRVLAFSATTTIEGIDDDVYVPDARRMGAFTDAVLQAHAAAWPFGQWLLGRRVPMAGIGGVTTVPEARGSGLGPRVLRELVEVCLEDGDVLSCLYPSLPGFYRSLGWADAGSHLKRWVRTEALRDLPRADPGVRVRTFDAGDDEDVAAASAVLDRAGAAGHGTLERGEVFHRRQFAPDDDLLQYVAVRDGRVTGFAAVQKAPPQPEDGHVSFRLRVGPLVGDDVDSWLALWSVIASHAPVCALTEFVSRPHEPLLDLLPRGGEAHLEDVIWQARLLDAPGAIAARGWPSGAAAEVHLAVRDPWLTRNDGNWVLRVRDGEATLESGGSGTVALDIGTFSSLYTGHATASDLAWQRRITGAARDDLVQLDEAFRSPAPWLDAYF